MRAFRVTHTTADLYLATRYLTLAIHNVYNTSNCIQYTELTGECALSWGMSTENLQTLIIINWDSQTNVTCLIFNIQKMIAVRQR